MKTVMYFDGGCRPNPGSMKITVIFQQEDINKIFYEELCQGTNNIAEWSALVYGLEQAIRLKIDELEAYGDSQLVINQFNGIYQVKKEELKPFYKKAIEYSKLFNKIKIKHVLRDKNLAGIYLEQNYT